MSRESFPSYPPEKGPYRKPYNPLESVPDDLKPLWKEFNERIQKTLKEKNFVREELEAFEFTRKKLIELLRKWGFSVPDDATIEKLLQMLSEIPPDERKKLYEGEE